MRNQPSGILSRKAGRALGLLLLLGICQNPGRAQQPEPKGMGVWYIYFADYGVSEKWSVHHETHLHLYEPLQAFNRFVLRAGPNYRFKPFLTGTFLYHYSYSDPTFAEEVAVNRLVQGFKNLASSVGDDFQQATLIQLFQINITSIISVAQEAR